MSIFIPPDGMGGGDRVKIGSEIGSETDAQAGFQRVEPLLTVKQLKERFLFGIPLVAAMPDPLTKKRAEYTDDFLKDAIVRAAAHIEQVDLGSGFHITPVQVTRRMPFNRGDYRALGFFRLPDRPILRMQSLQVKTADSTAVYNVPITWCDPGQFKKGQLNIIPIMPAFAAGGGVIPSFSDGGAAWISILGQASWIASYWELVYVTGFEEGHVPLAVNEAVGLTAAIDVLGKLAATYRISSYSTGLDAASQSVSSPGPAIYDAAIQRMEMEKKAIVKKMKGWYYGKLFCEDV